MQCVFTSPTFLRVHLSSSINSARFFIVLAKENDRLNNNTSRKRNNLEFNNKKRIFLVKMHTKFGSLADREMEI